MANNILPYKYKPNFQTIKEPTNPAIHFEAKALPRSYGFKVKWTKEEKRLMNGPDYRIVIKIYEQESEGRGRRQTNFEPKYLLTSKNYKWDVRGVNPDKKYIAEISLHYSVGRYSIMENAFAIYRLLNCQSYITEKQNQILFVKAKNFCQYQCGGRMDSITHLHKSEDDEVWKECTKNFVNFESGICKLKSAKRNMFHGHRVPGIERIPGVAFFARPTVPNPSPFGHRYVSVPIGHLMKNPLQYEFYFWDIRCYFRADIETDDCTRTHYISIVIAKKGSFEQAYCAKRLGPALIKEENPFFRIEEKENGEFKYFVPGVREGTNLKFSKCFLELFFAKKGHLAFDWKKAKRSNRNEKRGNVKAHYEKCSTCSYLMLPFQMNPMEAVPRILSYRPSNSFVSHSKSNKNIPSYPTTPEPDAEDEEEQENMNKEEAMEVDEDGEAAIPPYYADIPNAANWRTVVSYSFLQGLFPRKRYNSEPSPAPKFEGL